MTAYFRALPRRIVMELEEELQPSPKINGAAKRYNDGYERGVVAEDRFLRVCNDQATKHLWPRWFIRVYRGSNKDDSVGIDFWAQTTAGRIPIQVKSSWRGRRKFHEQNSRRHIVCIVVSAQHSDHELVEATIREVEFIWDAMRKAKEWRGA